MMSLPVSVSWMTAGISPCASHWISSVGSSARASPGPRARQIALGLWHRCCPSWKRDATSAASAPPSTRPSRRCSSRPMPPDAMTGTAPPRPPRGSARGRTVAGAVAVHAGEQLLASAQRSRPLGPTPPRHARRWPPRVTFQEVDRSFTLYRSARLRCASRRTAAPIATTMHWLPRPARSRLRCRVFERGRVERHLVRAGQQQPRMSSSDRMPPPTVSGMNMPSAVAYDVEHDVPLLARGGDVEEHELVGALGVVGLRAGTGSPASRSSMNFTPFTTRPSLTSRQG